MSEDEIVDSREEFESAVEQLRDEKYMLRLHIAGTTRRSEEAVKGTVGLCE